MQSTALDRFLERVREAAAAKSLISLTLSGCTEPDARWRNVYVRPVVLKRGEFLQFVRRSATQDDTRNLDLDAAMAEIASLLATGFRNAHLFTVEGDLALEQLPGRPARLRSGPPTRQPPPSAAHDRAKPRQIDPGRAPWLHGLGVTNAEGSVRGGMEAKFRQIDKFVELLSHLVADAGFAAGEPLRLVDMGCGKAYLTFAAYEWLRAHGWPSAEAEGIEGRAELVELARRVAGEQGLSGLHFRQGQIAEATVAGVDILLALHACDTATDDALARGIAAGARLVMVAPCCHKELRPLLRPAEPLASVLHHGILRERQAEFVTDALRAGLLECSGYEARVFEFVSVEHTARNLMIAALKRRRPADPEAAARRVRDLAALYGITHQRLADQLGFSLVPVSR